MRSLFAVFFSASFVFAACKNNPADDAPQAKTQPASVAPAAAPPAEAGSASASYRINNTNSAIEFVGSNVTETHEGKFDTFDGAIQMVQGDPARSSVSVDIKMGSVSVQIPQLQDHLKSVDFFDAKHFPSATFESSTIQRSGGDRYQVTGNLTLRGITKVITFPATIAVSPSKVSVQAEFSINRKDFGIEYPGLPDDLIKDNVLVRLKMSPASA
jgi:polyisoprenoid-binding protein YceI